jgi:hypothetical protein
MKKERRERVKEGGREREREREKRWACIAEKKEEERTT